MSLFRITIDHMIANPIRNVFKELSVVLFENPDYKTDTLSASKSIERAGGISATNPSKSATRDTVVIPTLTC